MHSPANSDVEPAAVSPLVGAVLPFWLEDSVHAQQLLKKIASREIPVYVEIPRGMVVIEQFSLFGSRREEAYPLSRFHDSLSLKRSGELIDEAVIRPDIRFLQLAPKTLDALADTLSATQHWFSLAALCTLESGTLGQSRPRSTLRCVRPKVQISKTLGRSRHPLDGMLPPPIGRHADFEMKIGVDSVLVDTHFVDELKAFVTDAIPADDRHNLGHDAPAVLHAYRAASKFSAALAALHRGNAPKDKERLEDAKRKVDEFLARFGRPFEKKRVRDVVFRVIDPRHPWGRGAGATSFKASASALDLEHQFRGEPYVTQPLGILIMMAKEIMAAKVLAGTTRLSHWSTDQSGTMGELSTKGFKGNDVQDVLATVLRYLPRPKLRSASRSVKKPTSYRHSEP